MKKLLLVFAVFVFASTFFVSCTPDPANDDTELATDKDDQERPGGQGD
jgi:hypothetical protein